MANDGRSPLEFVDQMYCLAFLMTGSLLKTHDLVYRTYEQTVDHTSRIELFKMFRNIYHQYFHLDDFPAEPYRQSSETIRNLLRQQSCDSKFAVLLSDICGFDHKTISMILGMPLSTIRMWLFNGRKSLLSEQPVFE